MSHPFPVYRIDSESAYERGVQYGQQASEQIGATLDTYRQIFRDFVRIDWEDAKQIGLSYAEPIERYDPRHGRGDPRRRRGVRPRARRAARAERALGDRPERTLRGRLHGLRGLRAGNPRRDDDPRPELGLAAVVEGLHGRAPRRAARKALADDADRSRDHREARLQLGRARRLPQRDRHRPARGRRHAACTSFSAASSTRATSARPCTRRRAPASRARRTSWSRSTGTERSTSRPSPEMWTSFCPSKTCSRTRTTSRASGSCPCAASASRHSRTPTRGSAAYAGLLEERHGEIDEEAARVDPARPREPPQLDLPACRRAPRARG